MSNDIFFVTDRLKSNEIFLTDELGKVAGSISISGGRLVFKPSKGHIVNLTGAGVGSQGPQGIQGPPGQDGATGPSGLSISGNKYSDYIYWNSGQSNWDTDGEKIHIGANAGQYGQGISAVAIGNQAGQTGQGNYAIAIGNRAGQTGQVANSIVINANSNALTPSEEGLFVRPVRTLPATGLTGSFNDSSGITSSQFKNVLSYSSGTNEITARELGLYRDNTTTEQLDNLYEEGSYKIVSEHSIVPNRNATGAGTGLSLGNDKAWWKALYAKEIHMSNNTLNVFDEQSDKWMSVTYNPTTLETVASNTESTVKAVYTSKNIPNQIDASLLPFTGLTFMGTINPQDYATSVSPYSVSLEPGSVPNFDLQTLHMLYNLTYTRYSGVDSFIQDFGTVTNKYTSDMFQLLNGSYYIIKGLPDNQTYNVKFSKLSAETDLQYLNKNEQGSITSLFTPELNPETSEFPATAKYEILPLQNNDTLFLSLTLERKTTDDGDKIFITTNWTQVGFKIPIGGVTTSNLDNFAVTSIKLANSSVTSEKITNLSITNDKLGSNSVTTDKIANLSITADKLANSSVISDKITNLSITSDKISNQSITFNKLSPDVQLLLANVSGMTGPSNELVNSLVTSVSNLTTNVDLQYLDVENSKLRISNLESQQNLNNTKFNEFDSKFGEVENRFTEVDSNFTNIQNQFNEKDQLIETLTQQNLLLASKISAIEEYIGIMGKTYTINTNTGEYKYSGEVQNLLLDEIYGNL